MAEPRTALDAALGALRHRDLSEQELERKLAAKGFPEDERQEALSTLRRTDLVDDARFATARAAALAARGGGDALIRAALARAGVSRDLVDEAIETLEPEAERARAIAERRGGGPKTARYLQGKGFAHEALSPLVASQGVASEGVASESLGELG